MSSIQLIVRGVDETNAAMMAGVHAGVRGGLEVSGAVCEGLVKGNISNPYLGKPAAVATGVLVNSITHQLQEDTGLIGREVIFAQPPADVYADYVEAGTSPHFPPPNALLLWVQKKFNPPTEQAALSIAFAIARTIARRGTFGVGMFARAFQTLEPQLQGIFESQIAQALHAAGVGA